MKVTAENYGKNPTLIPVDVGDNFRLIGYREVIEEGAQCLGTSGNWFSAHGFDGKTPEENNKCLQEVYHIQAFRRPIVGKDGWIKITDRLPRPEEYPVWVGNNEGVLSASTQVFSNTPFTHWQSKPKEKAPPLPKVEKPAIEVAFEKVRAKVVAAAEKESVEIRRKLHRSEGTEQRARWLFDAGVEFGRQNPK